MDKRAFKTFYGEEIAKKCTVCYNGVDLKRFFPPSLKKGKNSEVNWSGR
ncbi:MAG: hypothetical protein KIIPBIDF_01224 [Candidatus Methanoperedenaceae archaeon GB50]|nr:MAG: hypothetical protein KIIPBIDF_01224 [Candidatus Methanoperedenaceae archaeon GB50]